MDQGRAVTERLLQFIDASPSPWHAVEQVRLRLDEAGFVGLNEADAWSLQPEQGYYVIRDGSSIAAFHIGPQACSTGFRIIGAHTDSPGLRIRPKAGQVRGESLALGVEIYGGPILATFADRDLALAGRVVLVDSAGIKARLYASRRPLLRLPTPAIHLNRDVNEQGLRFEPQEELQLVLGAVQQQIAPESVVKRLLAEALDVEPATVASWDLAVADTQPGAFFGLGDEFIAAPRLDNLASCHAATEALLSARDVGGVALCIFFDHEEVGSQSYKGAEGSFLTDVVSRINGAIGCGGPGDERALLSRSLLLSVDMAHGLHPNYQGFYDERHAPLVNGGPTIKINAKQRYATDSMGQAYFQRLCAGEGVPCQVYVHRNNLPCGSTIGPIAAARLGVRTIDVGNPMWSMHSARESAGAHDHWPMIKVMRRFLTDTEGLHL